MPADQSGDVVGLEIGAGRLRKPKLREQRAHHLRLREIALQEGLLLGRLPAMAFVLRENFLPPQTAVIPQNDRQRVAMQAKQPCELAERTVDRAAVLPAMRAVLELVLMHRADAEDVDVGQEQRGFSGRVHPCVYRFQHINWHAGG